MAVYLISCDYILKVLADIEVLQSLICGELQPGSDQRHFDFFLGESIQKFTDAGEEPN